MSHKSKHNFNAGDLVVLRILNKSLTEDGLSTFGSCVDENYGRIYEFIRITSYPSTNDFFGKSIAVRDGERAIVLSKVGRPFNILNTKTWCQYDVYEILLKGYTFQVFGYNLENADE